MSPRQAQEGQAGGRLLWSTLQVSMEVCLECRVNVLIGCSDCDAPLSLTNHTLDFLDREWAEDIDFVICSYSVCPFSDWRSRLICCVGTGDSARYAGCARIFVGCQDRRWGRLHSLPDMTTTANGPGRQRRYTVSTEPWRRRWKRSSCGGVFPWCPLSVRCILRRSSFH